jgi:hypothetical protein
MCVDYECEIIYLFLLLLYGAASLVGLVAQELGFDSGLGQEILVYPRASILILGLIQPLFSGCWSIFIRLKQLELEVELLHPSSAEVKNEWSPTSI